MFPLCPRRAFSTWSAPLLLKQLPREVYLFSFEKRPSLHWELGMAALKRNVKLQKDVPPFFKKKKKTEISSTSLGDWFWIPKSSKADQRQSSWNNRFRAWFLLFFRGKVPGCVWIGSKLISEALSWWFYWSHFDWFLILSRRWMSFRNNRQTQSTFPSVLLSRGIE